jgi:hypothetical protein
MTSAVYPVDRWIAFEDTDGTMTAQQSSTAPSGFNNSVVFTTTLADASLGATQFARTNYRIEGYNVSDFAWGTASAAAVTLSFWVRSSLTGTFGGSVSNSAFNRSYPFTYTISVANTFEQKTITIAGDTSGTWLTTNGIGMEINFGLGVGSTYSGTAGAWAAAGYISATGATPVIGTLNATFYITGVQLEKGSTATSFDFRDYGSELAMCQRYYEIGGFFHVGYVSGIINLGSTVKFVATKRASPTLIQINTSASNCSATTQNASTGVPVESFLAFRTGIGAGGAQFSETWTASSEL